MIKPINGYEGKYAVDEKGNIYSYCVLGSVKQRRTEEPSRILVPHTGENSEYLMVGLSNDDGTRINALVHRLVAQAFIPNPSNLPEVDHIDNNPQNNNVENLQWVSRKENMAKVYKRFSPKRNYKIAKLSFGDKLIGYFESEQSASKYASKHGASASSLIKYKHSRGWILERIQTIPQGSSIWDENGCEVIPGFGLKT